MRVWGRIARKSRRSIRAAPAARRLDLDRPFDGRGIRTLSGAADRRPERGRFPPLPPLRGSDRGGGGGPNGKVGLFPAGFAPERRSVGRDFTGDRWGAYPILVTTGERLTPVQC